jgi:hypothetical protein
MPLWSPAKDEKGTAVVSEYTLPIKVAFKWRSKAIEQFNNSTYL